MTIAIQAAGPIPQQPFSPFPQEVLDQTAFWLREFSLAFHEEVPRELHVGLGEGGNPEFHPDFLAYIDRPCKKRSCHNLHCTHDQDTLFPSPRRRTTQAFRKLRRVAPREYDVLRLLCVYGLSIHEVAERLTERAVRLGKPERYGEAAVIVLTISGVDKLMRYW